MADGHEAEFEDTDFGLEDPCHDLDTATSDYYADVFDELLQATGPDDECGDLDPDECEGANQLEQAQCGDVDPDASVQATASVAERPRLATKRDGLPRAGERLPNLTLLPTRSRGSGT